MFKIYIKTAIRHLLKHKMHTLLNITGLVVAFTCAFLIFLFVKYEFSYDKYQENANNIYRVVQEEDEEWRGTNLWNATSGLLKTTILENCPEVTNGVKILPIEEAEVVKENRHILEKRLYFTEPQFLEIFTCPFIEGDPKTSLIAPKSLVLTEDMAAKYFPDGEDPLGKALQISNIDFTITGIMKNIPENSHFPVNFLASYQTVFDPTYDLDDADDSWSNNNFSTYIQLQDGVDAKQMGEKITRIINDIKGNNSDESYQLQNIKDIHLYSHVNLEADTNGNILYVYIFTGIAILLLLIAGFNYMNLTSAQILFFAKETSVRKISGANRYQILLQVFAEAILISLIAFLISISILGIILPFYSQLIERELTSEMIWSFNIQSVWIFIILGFAVMASAYPALQMLKQQPVRILKINKIISSEILRTRNTLVVIQFAISIVLIAGTLILYKQLNFIKSKELGFQEENIVNIQIPDIQFELKKQYETFKNELNTYPNIIDVTYAQTALDMDNWGGGANWEGKSSGKDIQLYHLIVDNNFLDFYHIKVIEGNFFSDDMKAAGRSSYILLNQSAVKALGWEEPVGRELSIQMWSDAKVIGVVEDFHYQPLRLGIEPLAISLGEPERHANVISVKIRPTLVSGTLNNIKTVYNKLFPGYQFNYHFLDEQLSNSYRTDHKLGKIFGILAGISIIVAALGLFGLASFLAKRRTKEIGIRKVNGAKVSEILTMLNKDFVKWVIIAFVIATPVAYFAMNKWLESFAYKTSLSWWIFALAGLLALGIALLTVSFQSWKAATRNPVEALRYE